MMDALKENQMADTEFSGDLMELDSAVFNPCYQQVTHMVMVIPATTDKAVVDYLVHGKDILRQVYDVALLPYHTVEIQTKKPEEHEREPRVCGEGEAFHYAPIPKWYTTKEWNEMQVRLSRKTPATCSFSKNPEYTIIHTAPTHNNIHPVVFEVPESMVESIPLVTKKTSKMVFKSSEQPDNPFIYDKVNSLFYGLHGMKLIDAKLSLIGGFEDHEEDGVWDEYYDYFEYFDDTEEGVIEITKVAKLKDISSYALRIADAVAHLDSQIAEEQKLTGQKPERIGWSYLTKSEKIKDALGCTKLHKDDAHKKAYVKKTRSFGMTRGAEKPLRLAKEESVTEPFKYFAIAMIAGYDENGNVIFGNPDPIKAKTSFRKGYQKDMKKAIGIADDIKAIIPLLTSEPQFASEVATKAGWSVQKASKILKAAVKAGAVKSVPVKNAKSMTLPTYFI